MLEMTMLISALAMWCLRPNVQYLLRLLNAMEWNGMEWDEMDRWDVWCRCVVVMSCHVMLLINWYNAIQIHILISPKSIHHMTFHAWHNSIDPYIDASMTHHFLSNPCFSFMLNASHETSIFILPHIAFHMVSCFIHRLHHSWFMSSDSTQSLLRYHHLNSHTTPQSN